MEMLKLCFKTFGRKKTDRLGFLGSLLLPAFLFQILCCGSKSSQNLSDSGADSGQDTGTEADAGADMDSDTDTDTGSGSDSDSDTDTGTDTDTDTETQTDTGSDTCEEIECEEPYVRFVDGESEALADGLSWETAYKRVQDGLDSAKQSWECCEEAHQVWVAEGTYHIYELSEYDTVYLMQGVALLGGFKGDETSISERDFNANKTVLDGENEPDGGLFVLHVVTGEDSAELDGFTITNGMAVGSESPDNAGGGMININADVTVRNCVFLKNLAASDPIEGVGFGGGMYNDNGSVLVENSTFQENRASLGGGLFSQGYDNSTELVNCAFSSNAADCGEDGSGGAVANFGKRTTVRNAVFWNNSASRVGGAYFENGKSTFVNCTFSQNSTIWPWGGGALHVTSASVPMVVNSIVWNNFPQEIHTDVFSSADLAYCDVRGGWEGDGNIDSEPMFADPSNGILQLSAGSPCIDAADGAQASEYDLLGNPRTDDPSVPNTGAGAPDYVDMGAYEHTM